MLPIHNRKSPVRDTPSIYQPAQNSHRRRSSIIISKRRNSPLSILRLRVNVTSLNGNHATLDRADRRLRARTSSWCTRTRGRRTQSAERSHHATGRHGDFDVFWAAGDELLWQAIDMNAFGCRAKGSSQHGISDIDISSRPSLKVRTARPGAERLIMSLKLDREIGLYPSFTYPSCCKRQELFR